MARKFTHEDVAAVPHGWKVRTVTRGSHRVRIAFPAGPRQTGSGRLISVLHPRNENPNPCGVRYLINPAELLIMGANPHRQRRPNPHTLGRNIARMKDRGASGKEVGRFLSRATANPHRRGRRGNPQQLFYYVLEKGSNITRAAQTRRSDAEHYLTPDRFIVGPLTADQLHRKYPRRGNPRGGMDAFARQHLQKWLDSHVHASERRQVGAKIRRLIAQDPGLADRGWPEVRRIAEANPRGGGRGRNPRHVRLEKLADGRVRILDKSTGEVLKTYRSGSGAQARHIIALDIRRFDHMLANPSGTEEAAELYEQFHGREPAEILELQEPEARGVTLTSLGDLIELQIVPVEGRKWVQLDFTSDRIKLASNTKGSQLYFIGGNQNLTGDVLATFGTDTSKELVELGQAAAVVYRAKKSITDFKSTNWEHSFGEESGMRPIVAYDTRTKRLLLVGGEYTIEAPGIIN